MMPLRLVGIELDMFMKLLNLQTDQLNTLLDVSDEILSKYWSMNPYEIVIPNGVLKA